MLHICGPCDGKVWVYSNCESVKLYANGRSLGKKTMPVDGHLEWNVGKATKFSAKGFMGRRAVASDVWPAVPAETRASLSKGWLKPDGQDVVVIDVESPAEELRVSVENAQLLGWGNGNPGFKEQERNVDTVHPFCGRCQLIIRSVENASGPAKVAIDQLVILLD